MRNIPALAGVSFVVLVLFGCNVPQTTTAPVIVRPHVHTTTPSTPAPPKAASNPLGSRSNLASTYAQSTSPFKAQEPSETVQYADYDVPIFEKWECEVEPDQKCSGDEIFNAPEGFQACDIHWTVTSQVPRGGVNQYGTQVSGVLVSSANLYPNEKEYPARYRAFRMRIWTNGTNDVFHKEGAAITLVSGEMKIIDDRAANADLKRAGCIKIPPV